METSTLTITPTPTQKTVTLNLTPKTSDYPRATIHITLNQESPHTDKRDTNLQPVTEPYTTLSISGEVVYKKGGSMQAWQCREAILHALGAEYPALVRLCEIWELYHLNAMKAGTEAQEAVLSAYRESFTASDLAAGTSYDSSCRVLEAQELLTDRGHKYGSSWLVKIIPDNILTELDSLIETLSESSISEKSGYDLEAENFLLNTNTVLEWKFIDIAPYWPSDTQARPIWEFTLIRGKRRMVGRYGNSVASLWEAAGLENVAGLRTSLYNTCSLDQFVKQVKASKIKLDPPSAYSLLASLNICYAENLDDFAADFGYSKLSETLAAFEAERKQTVDLERLFNSDELDWLSSIT